MFCGKCGAEIKDGDSFCTNCGAKVNDYKTNNDLLSQIKNTKCVTEYNDDTCVDKMECVKFGNYPQNDATGKDKEPIEWLVIDKEENKVLLLSKHILFATYQHHDESWSENGLRTDLNSSFIKKAFSLDEQSLIIETNNKNEGNEFYGIDPAKETIDMAFCLSINEVTRIKNKDYRKAKATKYSEKSSTSGLEINDDGFCPYFLRDENSYISSSGDIQTTLNYGNGLGYGVRPAIWVKI